MLKGNLSLQVWAQ